MDKREEFGRWIKAIRIEKGLTLQNVSKAMGYKTSGLLNNIERGIGPLPVEKIHPIANIYEIEMSLLLQKIEDCEPELYEKYMTLQGDLFAFFTSQVSRLKSLHNSDTRTLQKTKYILSDLRHRAKTHLRLVKSSHACVFLLYLLSYILLSLSSPCLAGEPWDTPEKIMFGSFSALMLTDCLQTNYIFDHTHEYNEINPIINELGEDLLWPYFAVCTVGAYFITDWLKPPYRKAFLVLVNALEISVTSKNASIGIKFSF